MINLKHEERMLGYYTKSYECILGVFSSDVSLQETLIRKNFKKYYVNNLNSHQKEIFLRRLNLYKSNISQRQKISFLIQSLESNLSRDLSVADIGCGQGAAIPYIYDALSNKDITLNKRLYIDNNILKKTPKDNISIYSKNLSDDLAENSSLDVIILVHSLHHMEKNIQNKVLHWCKNKLSKNGILYVVEDSWNDSFMARNEMDEWFLNLTQDDKLKVYELNEYVSNQWFYNYDFTLDVLDHNSTKHWIKLIESSGLYLSKVYETGFLYNRLHGVPQSSLLFKNV